jgi:membrane protein DedA with SNARE-associated domain
MGVIKAVVPFVAGLVRMDFKKFIYLNIISGLIFAIFYLGLGFFLGVSMDRFVVPKDLRMLVVALPFLIFFIWIIFESRTKLFKAVKKFFR